MRLSSDLDRDLERASASTTNTARLAKAIAVDVGLLCTGLFRLQDLLWRRGHPTAARLVCAANHFATGAHLLPGAVVGPGLRIPHPSGVVVGVGAVIGENCTLLQQTTIGETYADGRPPHRYPRLGDHVTVGAGARLLGGITIGDGAVIGANAVVMSDVPDGATAVGVPARILPARSRRSTR